MCVCARRCCIEIIVKLFQDLPGFLACATVVHSPYSSALVEQLECLAENNVQTGKVEPHNGYRALIQLHMYSCDGLAQQGLSPSAPPATRCLKNIKKQTKENHNLFVIYLYGLLK